MDVLTYGVSVCAAVAELAQLPPPTIFEFRAFFTEDEQARWEERKREGLEPGVGTIRDVDRRYEGDGAARTYAEPGDQYQSTQIGSSRTSHQFFESDPGGGSVINSGDC